MPRSTAVLAGLEVNADQIPISVVQLNIPGYMTGTDVWGTAPVVNHGGGYSAGATSIVVSGLGAGTIPIGAAFVLGGNYYALTAAATTSGGGATLVITPGLYLAASNGDALRTVAFNMCDLDVPVYLNTTTGTLQIQPLSGATQFLPYAGLKVPQIEEQEDSILSEVTLSAANQNEDWFNVMKANLYRETLATIWQGNLILIPGHAPDAATFQGVVKRYVGRVEDVQANRREASVTLSPHINPLSMQWPYRTYTAAAGFMHLPKAGAKVKVGQTVTEI